MIVSKDRIRMTVANVRKSRPNATDAEVHHAAAAILGLEADTVRIVMNEQAGHQSAEIAESEN